MATVGPALRSSELIAAEALLAVAMPKLRLGISLQPRWPIDDGPAVLRAARHAEDLGFDHVAVGNRLLDSGSGLASAAFLTPPGFPAAVPSPGRPLGGQEPTALSVADGLNELAEAGSFPARSGCRWPLNTLSALWIGSQRASCRGWTEYQFHVKSQRAGRLSFNSPDPLSEFYLRSSDPV